MNHRQHPFHARRGSGILAVLLISVVLGIILASVIDHLMNSRRLEARSQARMRALYAADFAIERNFALLKDWLDVNRPSIPEMRDTTELSNRSNPPSAEFPTGDGYTFDTNLIVPIEDGVAVANHGPQSQATNSYRFLSMSGVSYALPDGATVKVGLQEELVYRIVPLFQYAIFYNQDLELFPGAAFTVGGRVHSNGAIYHGSGASLTFNSFVTSVDGAFNERHPLDPRGSSAGSNITYGASDPFLTEEEVPPATIASGSNPNAQGPRELIEVPDRGSDDPNARERMFSQAGLKVLVNSTGSIVTAPNGVDIPANDRVYLTADGTVIPSGDPLHTALGAVFHNGSVKDYREHYETGGADVATTDVRVDELRSLVNAGALPATIPNQPTWPSSPATPLSGQPIPAALRGKELWNSQLYVADVTYSSTNRVGVRLRSGEFLPPGGLTVTTENAAYIEGNYNTGGNPEVNSSSDLAAPNTVGGYYEPAAVLADAVTVLSGRWTANGYNTQSSLGSRDPVPTTVNTAIVSGIVLTSAEAYSGGAENYLRLLEDWSGVRLTYYGSIVNLYASEQADSIWRNTGLYYNAPRRNWYFDLNFNDPNRLPKGTPVTRALLRRQWMEVDDRS